MTFGSGTSHFSWSPWYVSTPWMESTCGKLNGHDLERHTPVYKVSQLTMHIRGNQGVETAQREMGGTWVLMSMWYFRFSKIKFSLCHCGVLSVDWWGKKITIEMILSKGYNIKCEKGEGFWILSECTVQAGGRQNWKSKERGYSRDI